MTAIRKRLPDFSAIVVLVVIAVVVAGYILRNERLHFPLIDKTPFHMKAAFSTAQAVTPGQGQTIRISGVQIGDISKVDLKNGQAIVSFDVDPKYRKMIHTNATALLRPKTGLKDMFVELDPGTAAAPTVQANYTIPIRSTLPDINPDEVFSALDADTRDYLKLLIQGAGQGLKGRGGDLQQVFRRFEPTNRDLARVTSAVATRRANLRRLITSLNLLNGELANHGKDLTQLVSSSATVFHAFASEQANISRTVGDLPAALRQTTSTLGKVQTLAEVLRPTADHLRPAVRQLDKANKAVIPFFREATPQLANDIRPFVREARPLVRDLKPVSKSLAGSTPDLTRTYVVLNHLFNMVGYTSPDAKTPFTSATPAPGYLFWIAWLDHIGANLFSSADAHGTYRPVTADAPCAILKATGQIDLSPILASPGICG